MAILIPAAQFYGERSEAYRKMEDMHAHYQACNERFR
jgi:hypothetical protein